MYKLWRSEEKLLRYIFVSATPVHGARGDDPVELLQDRLPRGPDQQDPTERTGRSTLSKVKENHCEYALDLVLPRCNAEVVIENLFKVFDTQNTGQVKLVKAKTWDPTSNIQHPTFGGDAV